VHLNIEPHARESTVQNSFMSILNTICDFSRYKFNVYSYVHQSEIPTIVNGEEISIHSIYWTVDKLRRNIPDHGTEIYDQIFTKIPIHTTLSDYARLELFDKLNGDETYSQGNLGMFPMIVRLHLQVNTLFTYSMKNDLDKKMFVKFIMSLDETARMIALAIYTHPNLLAKLYQNTPISWNGSTFWFPNDRKKYRMLPYCFVHESRFGVLPKEKETKKIQRLETVNALYVLAVETDELYKESEQYKMCGKEIPPFVLTPPSDVIFRFIKD